MTPAQSEGKSPCLIVTESRKIRQRLSPVPCYNHTHLKRLIAEPIGEYKTQDARAIARRRCWH